MKTGSVQHINNKLICSTLAPDNWQLSCINTECTMHQLSPYIGKLKSSIANYLIKKYSEPGELIVDPFCGSGTIPLESILNGRRVFASDINPYSQVLVRAKLDPPKNLKEAIERAYHVFEISSTLPCPLKDNIPDWIIPFFHPDTLCELINFAQICREKREWFLLACFMGILHHQRPGFLSYPSNHLVPYLLDKKYPINLFPEYYKYRDIRPRLLSKIQRAYLRYNNNNLHNIDWTFQLSSLEDLKIPPIYDCLITSPPYMNALDYGRDNRLRLWFSEPNINFDRIDDNNATNNFKKTIHLLIRKQENHLKSNGYFIIIVAENIRQNTSVSPSNEIYKIMDEKKDSFTLIDIITDRIPNIRRARRNCRGVKIEHLLIFRKL